MATECIIRFDTDNAAFDGGNGPSETASILHHIATRISDGHEGGAIYDTNGNRIGAWSVDYPEGEEA